MLLHGIFPPITTPFYPDGKVYFKKLEHNVGLLRLNLNEAAALENFLLSSLRIWAKR